ncbi:oxidoreductase, zinc-binding [Coccidioides immitis RS]|uniref:Oxidoreductase, zinc-binding n=2 Tax=Coccidioides immitis TaxID=5501 RepID=A0A0D8JYN6_COCIM|nr:oxidoreductase, zinc-binding [Coccidioides immitis RS]KJF61373.1 oxidoreductase, zinc-binding [Coccidioides immitis RS]KMU85824.1 zinc-containing alcohol dehydrogenase superfamily protein [Coccidioides immitis H538.4]
MKGLVPSLPTETSVLVRVSHVALHPGTIILMHLVPSLFRRFPAIAETDFSGVVVGAGAGVPTAADSSTRNFPVGTPVFGSFQVPVHLSSGQGALAEYIAIEFSSIAQKPDNVSYAAASALGASLYTAITLIDAAKLPPRFRVLINAACGGVGHFATQLLKHRDPEGHIVGICSLHKETLAKQLGCDEVIDYRAFPNSEHRSLTEYLTSRYGSTAEDKFDAIFDAYGSQDLWESSPGYLKSGKNHVYATVGPKVGCTYSAILGFLWKMAKNTLWPALLGGVPRVYRQISAFLDTDGLEKCREVAVDGSVKAYLGGVWEMEEMMLAYKELTGGHAQGKLVIKVWDPEN